MASWFGEPFELDRDGDHVEASSVAFEKAIVGIIEADFDPMVDAGAPLGMLLFALSCAV